MPAYIGNVLKKCWNGAGTKAGFQPPIQIIYTMRSFTIFVCCLLMPLCLIGQTVSREEAHEALRAASVDQDADFASAYATAEKAGVSEASLLESKVLHSLSSGDLQGALALVPEMDKHVDDFVVGPNGFFGTRLEVEGLIENLKALRANEAGDWDAFEQHAKEGFWKSPQLSNSFQIGRLVDERHESLAQQELMGKVRLPMDLEILSVDGTKTTLAKVAQGQKAVLLDFWASWCGPCISLMPELKKKSEVLPEQGVFVAGMNTDSSDQLKHAREVQEKHGMDMPWLIEPDNSPFSRALAINSIPRMILLTPEGKVLFNGHPMDPTLKTTLASIGVKL